MPEILIRELSDILDAAQLEVSDGVPALDIPNPIPIVYPSTPEQVADILRLANSRCVPVVPIGNGSRLHLGNIPSAPGILLSVKNLSATLDYEPRDLTVIVQAGKSLRDLQRELSHEGQFLALDPPNEATATLGGILATNASGPLRREYGTPRDLTLGMKAVLADGTLVKGGGRVVKNVAGYDTTKLFVGSLGTLGVFVEAAFRLHPLPETQGGLVVSFSSWEAVREATNRIIHSELQSRCLEILNLNDDLWGEDRLPEFAPTFFVAYGGLSDAVEYQLRTTLERLPKDRLSAQRLNAVECDAWRRRIGSVLRAGYAAENTLVWKMSTAITDVLPMMEIAARLAEESGIGVQYFGHSLSGIVYGIARLSTNVPTERVTTVVERWRKELASFGGSLVVESAPNAVKRELDVWGEPTGPVAVMRQIKDRLDPKHILNRGRYLRGLE